MALFNDLRNRFLGGRAPLKDERVIALDSTTMGFTGRRRQLEVAGEFYRQQAFVPLVGAAIKTNINVNIRTIASLVPEPSNRHDPNAIRVIVDSHHVGYLDRSQAANYHQAMQEIGHPGRALTNIEARIFGHRLDQDGHGGYGVALYLPESFASKIGYGPRY